MAHIFSRCRSLALDLPSMLSCYWLGDRNGIQTAGCTPVISNGFLLLHLWAPDLTNENSRETHWMHKSGRQRNCWHWTSQLTVQCDIQWTERSSSVAKEMKQNSRSWRKNKASMMKFHSVLLGGQQDGHVDTKISAPLILLKGSF